MNELGIDLSTVVNVAATGGVAALVYTVIQGALGWRRLGIEQDKQDLESEVNALKMYADEVKSLRSELSAQAARYISLLETADKRAEECHAQRDRMNKQLFALRDEIAGLIRMIVQQSATTARLLGQNEDLTLSVEVSEAIARVDCLFDPNCDVDNLTAEVQKRMEPK